MDDETERNIAGRILINSSDKCLVIFRSSCHCAIMDKLECFLYELLDFCQKIKDVCV